MMVDQSQVCGLNVDTLDDDDSVCYAGCVIKDS